MPPLPDPEAIAAVLAAPSPVAAFVALGGTVRFTCCTNYARLGGVAASCTASEEGAVRAWAAQVERRRAKP